MAFEQTLVEDGGLYRWGGGGGVETASGRRGREHSPQRWWDPGTSRGGMA